MVTTRTAPTARLAGLLLLLVSATPAAAQTDYYNTDRGRPLVTEDASPVEWRALELQLAPLRLERTRGGRYSWGIEPEVAVGILPRTQLEIGLPLAFRDGVAGTSAGLAGVEVSMLHALNVETSIPAFALAASALLPAGGLGPDRSIVSLAAIATRTRSWGRVHVNAEYTLTPRPDVIEEAGEASVGEASRWQAGVSVDRPFPLRSLLVGAEVVAREPLAAGDTPVEWSSAAGVRYQVSPRLAMDAGSGYRFGGHDRGWFATVGAAVVVGLPWRGR